MSSRTANTEEVYFKLPRALVKDLRRTIPRTERNKVVARAVERELRRVKLLTALDELVESPAWSAEAHPELMTGEDIDAHIHRLRATWQLTATR